VAGWNEYPAKAGGVTGISRDTRARIRGLTVWGLASEDQRRPTGSGSALETLRIAMMRYTNPHDFTSLLATHLTHVEDACKARVTSWNKQDYTRLRQCR